MPDYHRIVSKWLFFIAMICHGMAMADEGGVSEARLKAAFIKNFVNFVSREEPQAPLNICIQGDRAVLLELSVLNQQANEADRAELSWIELPASVGQCNALYLSGLNAGEMKRLLSAMPGKAPLTISDLSGFAKTGGMVELIRDGNRFRFEVNYKSTSLAGLNIDGRLLRLASWVHTNTQLAEQ